VVHALGKHSRMLSNYRLLGARQPLPDVVNRLGRSPRKEAGRQPGRTPNQWVELANGRYISEKDPGYPFLAAPFEALGIIRWAPLFFGALACLGLFIGARAHRDLWVGLAVAASWFAIWG